MTLLLFLLLISPLSAEGDELIGTRASDWQVSHWINSEPLTLEELRGKVVLVRWWTAPGCPFCAASAPVLNEMHEKYRDGGLVVVGFYHHKTPGILDPREVREYADRLGFQFPVAIDLDWKTLHEWWLSGGDRGWTSVTFLIDREGMIRYIHPGGAYETGSPDSQKLESMVESLVR